MVSEAPTEPHFSLIQAEKGPGTPLNFNVEMGSERTCAGRVGLVGVKAVIKEKILTLFGDPPRVWFEKICTSDDFKTYFPLVRLEISYRGA